MSRADYPDLASLDEIMVAPTNRPRTASTAGGTAHRRSPVNDEQPTVPPGFCQCGCGEETALIKYNDRSKGWVAGEWRRYIHGHALQPPRSVEERFWMKVERRGPDECWEWQAATFPHTGYGMFWDGTRITSAHRASVELAAGEIPEGLHVDHLCCNRKCVNPAHLEPVTPRLNARRAVVNQFLHLCCDDCRSRLQEWTCE